MSESIDLSKIPVFLTVAKHGSFTEAAYELFMSQSGVSKAIASLEDSVGFPLFTRDARKISLTAEGACLYQRFLGVMQDIDKAVIDAKNIHTGDFGSITIGTSGYLPKTPAFEEVCSRFSQEHPAFNLDMQYLTYVDLRKKLVNDSLDLILYNTHDLAVLHGFRYISMMKGRCTLYYNGRIAPNTVTDKPVPEDGSPAALTIEDFRDRPFISLNPDLIPSFYTYLQKCCRAHGFIPNVARYTESLQELIHYITISNYVSVFDKTLFPIEDPDLCSVSVPHMAGMESPMETVLAWKIGNTNPALEFFISFASELLKEEIKEI